MAVGESPDQERARLAERLAELDRASAAAKARESGLNQSSIGPLTIGLAIIAGCVAIGLLARCGVNDNPQLNQPSAQQSSQESEAPPKVPLHLEGLKPIELSTLVMDAMPPEGAQTLNDSGLSRLPLIWENISPFNSVMTAYARVRVNGRIATVNSGGTKEELPWVVTWASIGDLDSHLGPQVLDISNALCTKSQYSNCSFLPEEAFREPARRIWTGC